MTDFHKASDVTKGLLAAGVGTTETSLTLQSGQGDEFPSEFPYWITISREEDTSNTKYFGKEVCEVTGKSADTLTVTRAQLGTTAKVWKISDLVAIRMQSEHFAELQTAVNTLEATPSDREFDMLSVGGTSDERTIVQSGFDLTDDSVSSLVIDAAGRFPRFDNTPRNLHMKLPSQMVGCVVSSFTMVWLIAHSQMTLGYEIRKTVVDGTFSTIVNRPLQYRSAMTNISGSFYLQTQTTGFPFTMEENASYHVKLRYIDEALPVNQAGIVLARWTFREVKY